MGVSMEQTIPCPACGRQCYGERGGSKRNPHVRYYCPVCRRGWNEQTLDQERRSGDVEILRRSRTSNPRGETGGIPNSDGYP